MLPSVEASLFPALLFYFPAQWQHLVLSSHKVQLLFPVPCSPEFQHPLSVDTAIPGHPAAPGSVAVKANSTCKAFHSYNPVQFLDILLDRGTYTLAGWSKFWMALV